MRFTECNGVTKPWSAITLGCWQIAPSEGWNDLCSPQDAEAVVKTALDVGITAFDTAEGYGDGESERRLGKALGAKKYAVVVISKIWPDADLNNESFQKRLDNTLHALNRDYVDLYLIHFPADYFGTLEKSEKLSELMFRLKVLGKVKAIGLSNFRADDLTLMGEGISRYVLNQVPYNLLDLTYEGATRDACERAGLPYMAYSPTAVGALARELTAEDLKYPARQHAFYYQPAMRTHVQAVFRVVKTIADEIGAKPVHVALAWVLAQPNILTAIVGSRKPGQVKELGKAGDLQLGKNHLDQLRTAAEAFHKIRIGK
jgi:aryl-alcohol dehydrogenase-like predicted oxidoreductase